MATHAHVVPDKAWIDEYGELPQWVELHEAITEWWEYHAGPEANQRMVESAARDIAAKIQQWTEHSIEVSKCRQVT